MKSIFKTSIFVSIFSLFASSFAAADFSAFDFQGDLLSKPKRYFELGVDADVAGANNLLGLKDILQKEVVIDLTKIANDMSDSGFKFSFYDREKVFVNLNISSRFRFSGFASVEGNAHFNISKDLFELLGNGLSAGESKTVDVLGYADLYANLGASFQTIIKGYGVKITPTYFIPLVYVPKTTATGKLTTSSNGSIRANAEANVDIYTAVNMHDFIEDSKTFDNLDFSVADLLSKGGLDLSLEMERNFFHNFNAGLYTRVPIIGGKLDYKMSTRVWAYAYEKNALGILDDTEDHDYDYGKDDFTYSEETFKVYRPFRLGLNATYTPFGQWLKIQPALGFAVRNPYTNGDRIFYMEYALDFRASFVKRIFNFNLGTAYQNQVFQQRFGFSLNLRVLEIMAQASMCGTTFLTSFKHDGYGAFVGIRMGF
ncbi:MAG: hypothetical protein IJ630_01955 [Treponema sp.]|nr:hypothetical protein [Treponema sp.]